VEYFEIIAAVILKICVCF